MYITETGGAYCILASLEGCRATPHPGVHTQNIYTISLQQNTVCDISKAYRAAEGGDRACNARSPCVDGEIQHVTKYNTSCHARECESTDRKRVGT